MVWVKPYNRKFLLEKIKEYNEIIKENKVGKYEVVLSNEKNEKLIGYGYEKENDLDIDTLKLVGEDKVWMELSAREIEGTYNIIKKAHGKVGIVGLGLGYSAIEISKKKNVKEVIVYESEKDVIDIFEKNFGKQRKIKIIHGDAFKAKGEKFDYFFSDIYEYKISMKIVEDYEKFNKLHKIKDYVFFGLEYFLLNARYEEVIWVFVPEIWMEMSKRMFAALQETNYLDNYKKLNPEVVSEVLAGLKPLLD
ncbi:hypothetical protein [Clostridium thermobutyricum]|uniref:hypothetical protein n=1 Tax=Clostridium thermobutyricum TaxID=29372 RepID=UPI003F52626C